MNIKQISKIELADGVLRYKLEIPSAEFIYTGYILESFEGICLYTTPDKRKNIMQVDVVPDYKEQFEKVLSAMREF